MRARTTIATALSVAAAALLTAGCGGSGSAGSSDLGGAASIAPSGTAVFVALDTDASSSQWHAVDDLLQKLPAHSDLTTTLEQSLAKNAKLSWKDDVQPALGGELDLLALPGAKAQVVALTQPADAQKLAALLPKLGADYISRQIGDWTAISDSTAALDAVQNAGTKLADNNSYQAAVAKLAPDALVRAYANGSEAQQLIGALGAHAPDGTNVPFAWASADVVAAGDSVRIHGYSRDGSLAGAATPPPAQPYASSLVDEIPAGALVVADFPVAPGTFGDALARDPKGPLAKLLGPDAITLALQLDAVLGGETALYVRPGLPIPEITLVTQPTDTVAATQALPDVLGALFKLAGKKAGAGLNLGAVHAVVGGQLVVSTTPQGLADFQSAGPKLSSDAAFKQAEHDSGMPAQTTGFLYANLASALPLVELLAPAMGVKLPPAFGQNAAALGALTAYGTRSGDESAVTAYLQLR